MLALWKRWGRGEGDPTEESALSAAGLAALNILGAALSMLWLILPHPGRAQELPIAGATLALCAVATVLIAGRQPKPSWLPHTAIAVDTFVVSVCLVATRDASSVYAFSYLWVGLYAACFFGLRQVAIHAAWLGIAYAGSLALLDAAPVARLTQWLVPMVTLLATGTLLRQLINRHRRDEARLRHAAGHDPLTGLANRGLFGARLEAALAEPGGDLRAVAFVDLDYFKAVNDSLGHAVGDALLVAVAERLRAHAGPSAFLARFGGDEFVYTVRAIRSRAARDLRRVRPRRGASLRGGSMRGKMPPSRATAPHSERANGEAAVYAFPSGRRLRAYPAAACDLCGPLRAGRAGPAVELV